MKLATRHHWNHPPPSPPQLSSQRRYNPFGIGLAVVLIGSALGYVGGQLSGPEPCITISSWARQDITNGYWYVSGVPVGWSEPGTDRCIQEVPDGG